MAQHALRTSVYVDGFNFYYGAVRRTPYKWLNPELLFQHLLGPQNQLTRIKYFTARIQPTPRDPETMPGRTASIAPSSCQMIPTSLKLCVWSKRSITR